MSTTLEKEKGLGVSALPETGSNAPADTTAARFKKDLRLSFRETNSRQFGRHMGGTYRIRRFGKI